MTESKHTEALWGIEGSFRSGTKTGFIISFGVNSDRDGPAGYVGNFEVTREVAEFIIETVNASISAKLSGHECEYSKAVAMPEYRCAVRCQYDIPPTIPPLDWHPAGGMKGLQAKTVCGNYWAYESGEWSTEKKHHKGGPAGIEAAKAAAQADFDRLILSTLSPPTREEGVRGND